VTLFKILGGLLALIIGIWWGMPGFYAPDREEIDKKLTHPGQRQYTKRMFTPLDWIRNKVRPSNRGGGISLKNPGATDEPDKRPHVSLTRARRRR